MNTKEDARIAALEKLLANTYTTYLKTQSYHWNVKGPMFTTLHNLFEEQYTELAGAIDEIAERLRALGAVAPGSFSQFMSLATVKEDTGTPPAEAMISSLAADQETICSSARSLSESAAAIGDQGSEDLAVQRMLVHQKAAWMLRSHLD